MNCHRLKHKNLKSTEKQFQCFDFCRNQPEIGNNKFVKFSKHLSHIEKKSNFRGICQIFKQSFKFEMNANKKYMIHSGIEPATLASVEKKA